MVRKLVYLLLVAFAVLGCSKQYKPPNLGELYTKSAKKHHEYGNPVIVIPGILGSRLVEKDTGRVVWGAFKKDFANPEKPDGARLIALPLNKENNFDNVLPDGALETVKVNLMGLPLELNAYINILSTLGAGGYRDDSFSLSDVDYGSEHFTCFQFAYDWRLDNIENAKRLHQFILEKKQYVESERKKRYGINREVNFDIVAHSMGGLIGRYYLMHGGKDLDEIADFENPGWEGAKYVENLIVIGTPNAGSVNALNNLINGKDLGPFLPKYEASILGTMPSLYQLLTRTRHRRVVDEKGNTLDLFNPKTWKDLKLGLMNPNQEEVLAILLPDVPDPVKRSEIAYDYLTYSLERAELFHKSIDVESSPPDKVRLYLIAGDSEPTADVYTINSKTGEIEKAIMSQGDGTVTRSSALMDERQGSEWKPYVITPVGWTNVMFIFSDHLGITRDPSFSDNVLYILLENPANRKKLSN
jgi:hypothetical protein